MPFDWRELLALARDLAGYSGSSYSTEAASRTSVSRAYYAAFCYVRNYAESKLGFQRARKARDHGELREHLRDLGAPWDRIGDYLEDLYKWRVLCDYEDNVQDLDLLVSQAIDTAEKIIQSVGNQVQCR
jgi:uncharacterized protein (UPF0332 family)